MSAVLEPTTSIPRSRPRYVAAPLPHRAAVYTRVSSKKQGEADKASLPTQEAGCRTLAGTDGYPVDVAHVYVDKHSGEELHERPQLTRLREAAKRREFAALYVHSTDRLSRDPIHLGIVLEELERQGIAVSFVTEPLDDSPEAGLIRYIHGYGSKLENARRRERSMRGTLARAQSGKLIPSNRPLYGYQWGPEYNAEGKLLKGRLVPDPITGQIVVRIYIEYASGASLRGIAARLTAEGIPTPSGKRSIWDPTSVRWILVHPGYWGQHEALRSQRVAVEKAVRARYAEKTRRVWRTVGERILLPETVVPPLVPGELAARVAARLQINGEHPTRPTADPDTFLLRGGIGRCGHCGTALRAQRLSTDPKLRPGAKRLRYTCGNAGKASRCSYHAIEAHLLDLAVWEAVSTVLRTPALIEQEVARMRETDPLSADTLTVIDDRIADLTRRIASLRRAAEWATDPDTTAQLAHDIDALNIERRQYEAERVAAQVTYAKWQQTQDGLEQALDWCERVGENLGGFTFAERRALLITLQADVRLYRADHLPRAELVIHLPVSGAQALALSGTGGVSGEEDSQHHPLRPPWRARWRRQPHRSTAAPPRG